MRIAIVVFLVSLPLLDCGSDPEPDEEDNEVSETGGASEDVCDPLAQDCGGGMACHVGGGDAPFECKVSPWSYGEGEPCVAPYDCAAGLYCASTEVLPACDGIGCCTSYCDLEDPQACAGTNTECVPFFNGEPPPMFETVGVCAIPN
jgi:hypothetical protein